MYIRRLEHIVSDYKRGMLNTPNIQVLGKEFSSETIEFRPALMLDTTFYRSTFKNSDLVNMKFGHTDFSCSYFEHCILEFCTFE